MCANFNLVNYWQGGKRENFNPNKTKEDADDGGDPMDVDDTDQAGAVEEPATSLDLRATETASNDAEEDSDDDMPMMSLKSKPIKNKKSKPTPTENSSRTSPSTESSAPKPQPAPAEPKKSKKSHPKTKLFSGTLRSAAAAHRNRQMHVPPIGSPGLLMLPNPSTVANFPLEDGTVDKKRKTTVDDVAHLLHNGYILPRTVYEQSMIAGGYTYEKRMDDPHRGSSTERTVDDMFDSDVSLYLHFPELIPLDLWERRLKRPKIEASDDIKADPTSDQQDLVQVKTENGTSQSSAVKKLKSEQPEDILVEEEKGPRLVDSLIQCLGKLTDDANNRTASSEPSLDSENSVMPDAALSQPPSSTESSHDVQRTKLPQLNPVQPGTRKRSLPHQPMTFLDMIPISLTSTYPPKYVEKRRAYAYAVMERENLIVESQEATDDATDNAEKYQAHKEAWDRMFEYQKQQIAKREAASEEADRKAKEEAELKKEGAAENEMAESKPETESSESKPEIEFAESNGDSNGVRASESKTEVTKERKKEDPMDYMPKPPELPPPERFITVPDIPIPPSPPSVLEIEDESMKSDEKAEGSLEAMHVPKVDQSLIRHLDPTCFLPTAEGRYFGLLSNYIADPLFVGPAAVGIRGITSGGGTGLATSYIGGGRGASGLISGPLRGGINSWQQSRETQSSSSTTRPASASSRPSSKKKGKKEPAAKAKPDEGKDDTKPSPEKSEASSSTSKKRRASETDGSDGGSSKKKVARVIPLATGDRNTLATEIASGPAGDEFPEGWTVKTYRRAGGETVGKTDRFWFSRKSAFIYLLMVSSSTTNLVFNPHSWTEHTFPCQKACNVFH